MCRIDACCFCAFQTLHFQKCRKRGLCQGSKRSKLLEDLPGQFDRIDALHAYAQEDRHQLGIC